MANIMGVEVRESTKDATIAADRVTENSRNNRPTIPPINNRGMKTGNWLARKRWQLKR